ncbi:MAG: lipopolysaccharide biosynthesis protein [Hyphomonadaceae bacterium]|uniref:lipopolysaccharide biosynthesis protein n=1 Tax=Vitreimonas flagellata TaxID=2560861 RepID=UPI001431B374|nr:lipopolysaccharide biosynthesis protein [Vitreimonas flagellata]MBX9747127.1 lipopolysaccharide biosynthesis protein [Hyphomonadaceae bacterium]
MSSGDPIFEAKHASMQTHAVNGALAIGIAQCLKLPFQAASLLILPRLLQPIDYGVYAMIDPLVSISALILNFGIGQALIQAPSLRRDQVSGLFWITALAGCAAAALMLGASPFVSDFYNDPRAGAVAAVSSIFLILTGLTNVHEALLNRQMKFGWVAMIGALGMALGFAASLIAALLGAGYWALVLGFGVQQLVSLLGVWLGVGWIPREAPSFRGLFRFYKFGAAIMVAEGATVMAREADSVLIGRYVGGAQLGFYDRGNKLAIIPIQRINTLLQQLLLPILSRLNDDGERYRYAYLRVIRQLMLFLTPGVVAVGATAPVLVPFVLGAQWAPAAPIFAWLTLAALHRPVSMSMDLLFISQARMRDYLAWSAFSTLTSVTAFVVGLRWGAVGVAAAFALSDLFVRMPALWWWATRRGPIRLSDLYLTAAPFAAGAATAFAALHFVQRLTFTSDFTQLVVSLILAYAISWSTIVLFRRGRAALSDTVGLVGTELPRLLRRQSSEPTGRR